MTDRTAPDRWSPADDKSALRRRMRSVRLALPDRHERSEAIWRSVVELPAVTIAEAVLAFATIPGEPEVEQFQIWCAATGRMVAVPEAEVEPTWPDLVIVPGLAFTARGERLGQGGGWYDRFLSAVRSDCATVGVCFDDQVVDELPTEPHDVVVDHVVTDTGVVR
jgi:5-formyltetrahydrofolate cyclo-ligase